MTADPPPASSLAAEPKAKPRLRTERRNALIDLLRGVSLWMVLGSHFGLVARLAPHLHGFGRSAQQIGEGAGYYGVVVFFVISGYLITRLSLYRYGTLPQIQLGEFWWLRFSRLMPMVLLCIAAMALLQAFAVGGFVFRRPADLGRAIAAVLCFRFNTIMGGQIAPGVWDPLWSLSVEEIFYLGFPIVCLLLRGPGAVVWLFIVAVSSSIFLVLSQQAPPYSAMACVDLLALGCLLAILRPDGWRERLGRAQRLVASWGSLFLGSVLVAGPVLSAAPLDSPWAPLVCAIGACLLLMATQLLHPPGWLKLALLPVTLCGVISYEAYLVHLPVKQYLSGQLADGWTLVVALGLALVLHFAFAEPLNQRLRRLSFAGSPTAAPRGRNSILSWVCQVAPAFVLLAAVAMAGRSKPELSVTLRVIDVKALPPGAGEPLASIGGPATGVLAFLRHDPGGRLQLGLDDWGVETRLSPPLTAAQIESGPITIVFSRTRATIFCGQSALVATTHAPRCRLQGLRLGQNRADFSTAILRARSTLDFR